LQKGPEPDLVNADEMTRYIRFLRKSVYFLPGLTPESLVWEENAAKELLGKELPEEVSREQDLKRRLYLLAEEIPGFDADTVFKNLFAKLLSGESQHKLDLIAVISKIRSATV
jgi:bacterioferritin (cytochrome b1)